MEDFWEISIEFDNFLSSQAFHPLFFKEGLEEIYTDQYLGLSRDCYFQKISLADKCCNFLLAFFAT
jgi:hypothetical protein